MGDAYDDDFCLDDDDCSHEDYDVDILTGRAECNSCNHRWFLSDAEWKSYERRMALFDEIHREMDANENPEPTPWPT